MREKYEAMRYYSRHLATMHRNQDLNTRDTHLELPSICIKKCA